MGICFDPTLALANHSCTPNAFISFDGQRASLGALSNIKKDEQIFVTYIDATQPHERRGKALRERYFFTCECVKCQASKTPYQTYRDTEHRASSHLDLLIKFNDLDAFAKAHCSTQFYPPSAIPNVEDLSARSRDDASNRLELLRSALSRVELLTKAKTYAYQPVPTIIHELFLHYTSVADYSIALSILLFKFLNCDVYNYTQAHHPTRVIALCTIARLLKTLADTLSRPAAPSNDASIVPKDLLNNIDFISAYQAVMILVVQFVGMSHGLDSKFSKEMHSELNEVEGIQKQRGAVGKLLKRWQEEGTDCAEGVRIAEKLFADLRSIADCAERYLETTE